MKLPLSIVLFISVVLAFINLICVYMYINTYYYNSRYDNRLDSIISDTSLDEVRIYYKLRFILGDSLKGLQVSILLLNSIN